MTEERAPANRVESFRRDYRARRMGPRYSGWGHLAFTTTAALFVIALAAVSAGSLAWFEWLVIPASFVAANIGEYVAHRWPMHRHYRGLDFVFDRHTRQHHNFYTHDAMAAESSRDFQMVLLPPQIFIFFVLFFVLPIAAALFALASSAVGWLFLGTAVGYFLLYEWLHLAYHLPPEGRVGRLRLVRRLRGLHTTHHDPRCMRWYNFNVTFPIGDLLFGTYKRCHAVPEERGTDVRRPHAGSASAASEAPSPQASPLV